MRLLVVGEVEHDQKAKEAVVGHCWKVEEVEVERCLTEVVEGEVLCLLGLLEQDETPTEATAAVPEEH
jgi:hypothetical protein